MTSWKSFRKKIRKYKKTKVGLIFRKNKLKNKGGPAAGGSDMHIIPELEKSGVIQTLTILSRNIRHVQMEHCETRY